MDSIKKDILLFVNGSEPKCAEDLTPKDEYQIVRQQFGKLCELAQFITDERMKHIDKLKKLSEHVHNHES